MTSQGNIFEMLERLGADPESISWQHVAACRNLPFEFFFDQYDNSVAAQVDQICLRCPVVKECFLSGTQGNETGVWGGFYLENGEVSSSKNKHKEKDFVEKVSKRIYD